MIPTPPPRRKGGLPLPAEDAGAGAQATIRAWILATTELGPGGELAGLRAALVVSPALPPGWLAIVQRAAGLTRSEAAQLYAVVAGKRRIPRKGMLVGRFFGGAK